MNNIEPVDASNVDQSTRQYEIHETFGDSVWELDLRTDALSFSSSFIERLGYESSDVSFGKQWSELFYPGDLAPVQRAFLSFLKSDHAGFEVEYRVRNAKDDYQWLRARARITARTPEGRPSLVTGIIQNVTEKKRRGIESAESDLHLDQITSSVPGMLFKLETRSIPELNFTYVSEGSRVLFGLEPNEFINDTDAFFAKILDSDRELMANKIATSFVTGERFALEYRIHKDGEVRWIAAVATLLENQNSDAPQIWFGFAHDVTERKRREEELEMARQRFGVIAQSIPGMLFQQTVSADLNVDFSYVSDGSLELFGVKAAEIEKSTKALFEVFHPEDRATIFDHIAHAYKMDGRLEFDHRICVNGLIKWVRVSASRIATADSNAGKVWFGLAHDITALRHHET
ncbi:MAG: PAS domain-containing protein [Pseudomonadota bacterium]